MAADGYTPGTIADIVGLHMRYYAPQWGFGLAFETKVATELSAFLSGFRPGEDFFAAHRAEDGTLLGTVSLQAPAGDEPLAHLRWFITGEAARGTGLGRRLLGDAIRHADRRAFPGIYLTTFAGLDAARHLYESAGFVLAGESATDRWSGDVCEQRFERLLPSAE